MAIIVEGMDNSGKTTLINSLKKEFGEQIEVIKPPGPFKDKEHIQSWTQETMDRLKSSEDDQVLVFDRFSLFSEPIYGPILRKKSLISQEELIKGCEALGNIEFPITLIYCRPPLTTIKEFGEREQLKGVKKHARELQQAYDSLINPLIKPHQFRGIKIIPYDWTGLMGRQDIKAIVRGIIEEYHLYKNPE